MTAFARTTLILGGARSGKSLFAENMFEQYEQKTYLATALAHDAEMKKRIEEHQTRRSLKWETIEEPIEIASIISDHSQKDCPLLIDCLTLWAINLLSSGGSHRKEVKQLLDALEESVAPLVMVSNEIGLGVIPENELSRQFVDLQGEINQAVAKVSDSVILVTAGLPIVMKTNE